MYSRGKFIIRNILSAIISILIVAISFFTIFNVTFFIVYKEYDVYGSSMQPTLNLGLDNKSIAGDNVYINRFADLNVNDVVIAKVDWHDTAVVKRIVGKPNDTVKIEIRDNCYAVLCNDKLLYTRPINFNTTSHFSKSSTYIKRFGNAYYDENGNFYINLKDDEYLLLGDNWTFPMKDCLENGPVKKSNIEGRVDIVIKYQEKNKIKSFAKSLLNLMVGKKVSLDLK